ncbi:FeoA family protein [Treponema lecithinolyticum]|uniref:FeoA family protein n=1 Tax=Treponema lecithinolyticum TaxID=53418 RepID=UPI0028E85D43|nr:FeoA family protein [Treponema lecithinolyticum]
MTLDELNEGEEGIIDEMGVEGVTLQRLVSLGFIPGTAVSIVRKAPFLDPFDISICGSMVAVRKDEARHIFVQKKGK